MCLTRSMLDAPRGIDADYDARLDAEFAPYRALCSDVLRSRLACGPLSPEALQLSAQLALEWAPLHAEEMPALWLRTAEAASDAASALDAEPAFLEFLVAVFADERASLAASPAVRAVCTAAFKRVSCEGGRRGFVASNPSIEIDSSRSPYYRISLATWRVTFYGREHRGIKVCGSLRCPDLCRDRFSA